MAPPPSPPVASRLRGVWRRSLLTVAAQEGGPAAVRDDTSSVFWLQTDSLFGDLRLPGDGDAPGGAARPPISFCGHTTTESDLCSWHRELDYGSPFLPGFDFSPPSAGAHSSTSSEPIDKLKKRVRSGCAAAARQGQRTRPAAATRRERARVSSMSWCPRGLWGA